MKNRYKNRNKLDARRLEAEGRASYYATLTPQQKLDLLDLKFGKGVGATKQRLKLAQEIKDNVKPVTKEKAEKVFKE